jgi:hypothetical protein
MPRAAVTLALAAAGCGGHSTAAPSSSVAAGQPPLTAGTYSLMLATGSGQNVLCMSVGGSAPTSITVPAVVELTPAGWNGRSTEGTLTFTLWQSGSRELAGTMSGVGKGESEGLSVEVGESDGSNASLVGLQTSGVSARGDVVGRVVIKSPASSLSCTGNTWSLTRR